MNTLGPLDLVVIVATLLVVTVVGGRLAGRQDSVHDFFLGGRRLPWWAVAASIVATEISAVTYVSLPSVVWREGGDLSYLQIGLLGSLIAKALVAWLLVPAYFERELYSPYDYMGARGIEYARNLEACPHLLDELRDGAPADLDLPDTLASDAEAALVGETVVEGGLLRGESSALLVAPGSGIAEAWLWCGEVRPIEGVRAWDLPPIREDDGVTDLEREGALLGLFGRWSGDQPLEQAAAEGDAGAVAALERHAPGEG